MRGIGLGITLSATTPSFVILIVSAGRSVKPLTLLAITPPVVLTGGNRWNQKRTMNRDTRNKRFKITHMYLINTFLLITCTIDSIVDSRQPFGNNEGSMKRMQEFFRSILLPYRAINKNEIANSIEFFLA